MVLVDKVPRVDTEAMVTEMRAVHDKRCARKKVQVLLAARPG